MYSYVKNFISYCVPILPLGCHDLKKFESTLAADWGCIYRRLSFSSPMFFEKQFFLLIHIQKFDTPPPPQIVAQPYPRGSWVYTTWWCFQLGLNFSGLIIKRFSIIVHYLNPLKKLPHLFSIRSLKSYKLTDRQMRHADKRKAHVSWKNKTVRKIYFIHF